MSVRFLFRYVSKNRLGEIYRPIAKVSFKSPAKDLWKSVWMIVDTGADFSILPSFVATDLGINLLKDCYTDETIGVGGNSTVFLLKKRIIAKNRK